MSITTRGPPGYYRSVEVGSGGLSSWSQRAPFRVHEVEHVAILPRLHLMQASMH